MGSVLDQKTDAVAGSDVEVAAAAHAVGHCMNSNLAADAAGPDLGPQFGFLGSSELKLAGIERAATIDSELKQQVGRTQSDSAGTVKETGSGVYRLLDLAMQKMPLFAVHQDADSTFQNLALVASRM